MGRPRTKKFRLTTKKGGSRDLTPLAIALSSEGTKHLRKLWKTMEQAAELAVDGQCYTKGCDVMVKGEDADPENIWVGRVRSIRRTVHGEIRVLVQWYYSPQDVEANEKLKLGERILHSFPPNERILTDEVDAILPSTLIGTTHVYQYDEEDVNLLNINLEQHFFVRYNIEKLHKMPQILPGPGEHTCTMSCKLPYNPFPDNLELVRGATKQFYKHAPNSAGRSPTEVERIGDYMHFCPRPVCHTWFHESCLLEPIDEADFVAAPDVRRLVVDPDRNEPHAQLARYARWYERPTRGKGSHGAVVTLAAVQDSPALANPMCPLPDALIAVAAMPILRRAGDGAFSTAGNVADVVLARRLVYQALDGWHGELERVMKRLDESWYRGQGDAIVRQRVERFLETQRILASPRVEYWDELLHKLEVHGERPVLHCPNCSTEDWPVAI